MGLSNLITQMFGQKTAAVKTSAAGPMIAWSGVGVPRWTARRFDALAEAGFRKNVIAYRCVMQVATASSAIPWLLYDAHNDELDRHPLLDLLRHPNPLQDGMAFLENVYAYLQISGNAFIEAVTPSEGETPVELYALRPDRMKVIPGATGLPQGYQYSINGQTTTWSSDPITGASNILHLKLFHPLDDWYGMAPLEAAQISIDQHNAAGTWNQSLLNHGARPSGALVFAPKDGGPSSLTDDQMQRLRDELGLVYQGSRNAGRPLILEGGLDWREMSLSPKDMDWIAGRNIAARDIALAFGVPAQLVGIPDAQTYANMAEARMALYEETVLPLVTRVLSGFDHWLTPMFGDQLELDFDPDEVSALAVRRDTQWNKLQSTDFLTINEKRHAIGYGPIEGGDVLDTAKKPAPAPQADPPAPALFTPAPATMPNAFASANKFNPNHDDRGRFTTGSGGGDDEDNGDDDSGNKDGTSDGTGDFLQWALGVGSAHAQEADDENRGAEESDPSAEVRTAVYQSALSTLRQLDPNNRELESISGPNWVPSQQDIDGVNDAIASASAQRASNFLMPNGLPVGSVGNGDDIRILSGNLSTAQQDFEHLTVGGSVLDLPSYRGIMMSLPGDGGLIGLRPESSDELPTLDVNVDGVPYARIHYK